MAIAAHSTIHLLERPARNRRPVNNRTKFAYPATGATAQLGWYRLFMTTTANHRMPGPLPFQRPLCSRSYSRRSTFNVLIVNLAITKSSSPLCILVRPGAS